jgi:nucleotide-binding universal stress UspA family protein
LGIDEKDNQEDGELTFGLNNSWWNSPFTTIVPIANPQTERYLIEMGALLTRRESGTLIPLSIAKSHLRMDEPQLNHALARSRRLLQKAVEVSKEFEVEAKPIVRIDDDIAHGISRTSREQNASLIIMGWSSTTSIQARLFGNVIDSVFWSSHCPIAVMRLLEEPINIHNLLVPVKNITPQTLRTVKFAQLFAETNQAAVTLLHVCDRKTSPAEMTAFESELEKIIALSESNIDFAIKVIRHDNVAEAIVDNSRSYDLVILRSIRRRTVAGLAVSDATTQVLKEITCSVVLFGEPHSN